MLGAWGGHAASWLDQGDIPVLAIRYEDLIQDPHGQLRRIAGHLGIPAEDGAICAAVAQTRFDLLQSYEQAQGFRERLPQASARFFRSGAAGQWQAVLSAAQATRIERAHAVAMARFGYI